MRQLDRAFEAIVARAWAAGAGPGSEPLTIDLDSTIVEVAGHAKQGASFGYTIEVARQLAAVMSMKGMLSASRTIAFVPGVAAASLGSASCSLPRNCKPVE